MVGLLLGAVQAGIGIYQYAKGKSDMNKLNRPTYNIPDEVKENLTDAQLQALEGLPEAQKKQYIENVQRARSASLSRARDLKSGLVGLSGVYQNEVDAYKSLLGQDVAARQANQVKLSQARGQMAQYKDKQFEVNQMQPYKQAYNEAQSMQGSGMQNIVGGLSSGLGSLEANIAQNKQLDYLQSLSQNSQGNLPFGSSYISPLNNTQVVGSNYSVPQSNYNVPSELEWMNQQNINQTNLDNIYQEKMNVLPPVNIYDNNLYNSLK